MYPETGLIYCTFRGAKMYFVSRNTGVAELVRDGDIDRRGILFEVNRWVREKSEILFQGQDIVCVYNVEGDRIAAFSTILSGTMVAVTPYSKELPESRYLLDDGLEIHGPNPWEAVKSISKVRVPTGGTVTVFDPDLSRVFNYRKVNMTFFGPKGDFEIPGKVKTEPRKSFDRLVLVDSYLLDN